jgi:hypothetical protein
MDMKKHNKPNGCCVRDEEDSLLRHHSTIYNLGLGNKTSSNTGLWNSAEPPPNIWFQSESKNYGLLQPVTQTFLCRQTKKLGNGAKLSGYEMCLENARRL